MMIGRVWIVSFLFVLPYMSIYMSSYLWRLLLSQLVSIYASRMGMGLMMIMIEEYIYGRRYPPIPSSRGLVVITDATERIGKELSYYLSEDIGMFVLGGKSDEKSALYTYEQHKGIEAISMRFDEPKDIAATLYRIKEINRDLTHRPLSSIIINQLDLVSSSSSSSFNRVFGLEQFDNIYKSRLKGLLRIMDMGTALLLNSTEGSSSSSSSSSTTTTTTTTTTASISRGRLIILSCKEMSRYKKGCGSSCLVDSVVNSIGNQINEDHDLSVSTIFIPCSESLSYHCEKKSLNHALHSTRPKRTYYC